MDDNSVINNPSTDNLSAIAADDTASLNDICAVDDQECIQRYIDAFSDCCE